MSLSNLLIIFSSSFMALFPVINPLGNGFVVNGFFTDLDPQQRKAAIQKLTLNFIMIGVGTLVIGHLFLLIFGLAIPVVFYLMIRSAKKAHSWIFRHGRCQGNMPEETFDFCCQKMRQA